MGMTYVYHGIMVPWYFGIITNIGLIADSRFLEKKMISEAAEVSTNYHAYFMWVQLTPGLFVTEQCFAALSMCIQALYMVSLRP